MPGIPSGSVDHKLKRSTAQFQNQEFFTSLFRFFNGPLLSGGYVELVALNTGSTAQNVVARGTNLYDEPGSFGECAMVVWRIKSGSATSAIDSFPSTRRSQDYYVLFQWSHNLLDNGYAPTSPTLVGGVNNIDGTFCAIAFCDDGTNPWNGTKLGNGNDNKGSPVWTTGSSPTTQLHVLPRSNCAGGTHVTLRENMVQIANIGSSVQAVRYHFIHDRDTFYMTRDPQDDSTHEGAYIHGTYEPLPYFLTNSGGVMGSSSLAVSASAHMPLLQATFATHTITLNSNYGSTTGGGATNGGIVCPIMSQIVGQPTARQLKFLKPYDIFNVAPYTQNQQRAKKGTDVFPYLIFVDDTPNFGMCGHLDFLMDVPFGPNNILQSGSEYACFAAAGGIAAHRVPWRGQALGSHTSRQGRQF